MKTKHYIHTAALFLAALLFAACADDEDHPYATGPTVSATCQQVHFASSNSTAGVIDPTNPVTQLLVKRNTTQGALSMPVTVVSKTEGLSISDAVNFADGDSTAYISIAVPDTATTGSYSYELRLEGDNVDPYSIQDGSNIFSGRLSFPEHLMATCWIGGDDTFNDFKQEILDMGGGKFYIPDFLNSGLSLWITAGGGTATRQNLTITSDQLGDDCYDTAWGSELIYLYDDTAEDYFYFYPYGKDDDSFTYVWIYNGVGYTAYWPDYKQFQFCLEYYCHTDDPDTYFSWRYLNMRIDE